MATVPSVLSSWPKAVDSLARGPVAVFLDFDGTLSPIVDEPGEAVLLPGIAEVIAQLVRGSDVAIVSGRGADDVRARVGVPGVWVAGSHGFEIVGPDGTGHDQPDAVRVARALEAARAELDVVVGSIPGVRIEVKRFGLTVHDRMVADEDLDRVRRLTDEVAAAHPALRTTRGKRVTELRPDVDWDKGAAVSWLLAHLEEAHGRSVSPIYIGDDATDEDAFAVLGPGALTVVVADTGDARTTLAEFSVEGPEEVRELLLRLVDALPLPAEHRGPDDGV